MVGKSGIRSVIRRDCLCMILAMLIPLPALSAHMPETAADVAVVDAEGLIDLVVGQEHAMVVDTRLQSDYVRGHIDGAINLPNTETDCRSLSSTVPHLDKTIVFYCNGTGCERSAESIRIARSCGYEHVYWFRGGFEEWLAKGYPYLKQ